jgi:hypothetical protein
MSMEALWGTVGTIAGFVAGLGITLAVSDSSAREFLMARACFWSSAVLLAVIAMYWELKTESTTTLGIVVGCIIGVAVFVLLPVSIRWVDAREKKLAEIKPTTVNGMLQLPPQKNRNADVNRAYSDLMGNKAILRQQFVSYMVARINFDYHNRIWVISGSPGASVNLDEAKIALRKCENLALEILKTQQKIYEDFATFRLAFPRNPEILSQIDLIYKSNAPDVTGGDTLDSLVELDQWQKSARAQVGPFVQREYSEPVDKLLSLVLAEIGKPSSASGSITPAGK